MNDYTFSASNAKTKGNIDTRHDLEKSRKNGAEEWRAKHLQYVSPAAQTEAWVNQNSDSYGMERSVLPIYDKLSENKKEEASEKVEKSKDIFKSTFESNNKLDKNLAIYKKIRQVPGNSECFLENQSQKKNPSFIWSICPRKENKQSSHNHDATSERSETFSSTSSPPLTKSGADATDRDLETQKLLRNQSMDASSSNKTEPSSQYFHAVSKEKGENVSLPKLPNVPHHLLEKLKDKLYDIATKDLWLFDEEHREHFAENFGITNICPLFVDHYGFAMWMLDENKRLLLWNEMENSIMYLGSNLTEGFTNYLINPDRLCYIMEDNFKLVPVDEFERQAKEMADMIWANRVEENTEKKRMRNKKNKKNNRKDK
ncbi:13058_t:CDS:2 [Funneliformis caledonium]|uniref:13058_t:CDS:1 n=1 Tax=Funneliformis caledonium TaxID=1117310 RepID=A0A9N9DHW6_9GLOM|nr:13058_t:CDS:2 [Funneliformis caledonium]